MRLRLFLFLLSLAGHLPAQINPDSLWNIWEDKTKTVDERHLAIYTLINEQYLYKNPDTALILAQQQLDVATRQKELQYIAQASNTLGLAYYLKGNRPMALEYMYKCMEAQEQMDSSKQIASTYNNIGIIHKVQEEYDEAMTFFLKSYNMRKEQGNKKFMAIALNNIGLIQKRKKQFAEAEATFRESLALKRELGEAQGIATTLHNLGELKVELGQLDSALLYYQASLPIRDSLDDQFGKALTLGNMSNIYYQNGDYPTAKRLGEEALAISKEMEALEPLEGVTSTLMKTYRATGQYQKALDMYDLYIQTRDTLSNEENTKKIIQQQLQYEYEKQKAVQELDFENELTRERNQRKLLYTGMGFLFLLGGISFRAYRQKRKDNLIIAAEKEKSDELLLNILPAETAEELKQKGAADAQLFQEVTVLFTDFKGFTPIAEQLSPQELVNELDYCFGKYDRIITANGLEKIKTIGDAYMCAGGLPVPMENHAEATINAALEIAKFMQDYAQQRQQEGKPYFQVRIGLHSGPVVAGIVGIKKFAYDIWGDTVNIASRMESNGLVGKVNISESTYQLVKDQYSCEARGVVEVKGKGKMKMYLVQG
jgi:adenylate cyclase